MWIDFIISNKRVSLAIALAITSVLLCFQNLAFYLIPNLSLAVFLIISPFVFRINPDVKRIRFAWFSMFFAILYFLFKMQLLYFLAFFSLILFLIESNIGAINYLPIFIILLLSPYSNFIFDVFGFPVRLILTEYSVRVLSFLMSDVSSSGNNILIGDNLFSVDAECMGLTMVGYGYATALLFINLHEKTFKRRICFIKVIGILLISTLFIVTTNLLRIVFIVIMQSKEGTFLHEIVGLMTFVIYFIVPIYYISKFIIKRGKETITFPKTIRNHSWKTSLLLASLIIVFMAYLNINRSEYRNKPLDVKNDSLTIPGYTKSNSNYNVMKFDSENTLIYIKPPCHFFAPDHSPTICWKGSGYEFNNIDTMTISNYLVYVAELKKGNEVLHTSWWFDNGNMKTISQLEWRWEAAKGEEPYRLINITSTSKADLYESIERFIPNNYYEQKELSITD